MTALSCAGVYRRRVNASLARIWENVFDWAHLPSLHAQDFAACTLIDAGDWGWRVRLVNQPGDETKAQVLELQADRAGDRYCVTTLEGPGAGSEIRVQLSPQAPHDTDVTVAFHVAESSPARLERIGQRYVEVYTRLWDEDEAMMIARERALAQRRSSECAPETPVMLGAEADVRAQLPMLVEFGVGGFRLLDLDGALVAHATTCPHWLGPLEDAAVIDGVVRCPWHGYDFDVRSGACVSGQALQLAPAPKILIADGIVSLVPND